MLATFQTCHLATVAASGRQRHSRYSQRACKRYRVSSEGSVCSDASSLLLTESCGQWAAAARQLQPTRVST